MTVMLPAGIYRYTGLSTDREGGRGESGTQEGRGECWSHLIHLQPPLQGEGRGFEPLSAHDKSAGQSPIASRTMTSRERSLRT